MRAKEYQLLVLAINEGVNYGWNRAFKHNDEPSDDYIKDTIENAVIESIMTYFDLDDRNIDYEIDRDEDK